MTNICNFVIFLCPQGCYVLDLLAETELGQSILRMSVAMGDGTRCDVEEELCESVVLILFVVCWKGVEGSDEEAWKVKKSESWKSVKHKNSGSEIPWYKTSEVPKF